MDMNAWVYGRKTKLEDEALAILEEIAPTIRHSLLGPLSSSAVSVLENALQISPTDVADSDARREEVFRAIRLATPVQLHTIGKAEREYDLQMQELLKTTPSRSAKARAGEHGDIKRNHARRIFCIGIITLVAFLGVVSASLWGGYALVTGKAAIKDMAMAEMVSGFGGTLLGYMSANAQQVMGYYFGGGRLQESIDPQKAQ